ncbi:MAG: SDH family Clp fold serine proteinase [Candidatus Nitrospinota bacterium M3_3B_026]
MSMIDVLWIVILISMLQPALKQRLLEAARQRLIAQIEKNRGSRVIVLVHRQETMSFLGFPLVRYININDSEEIMRAIHMTGPDMPVDLIMHTPGGVVLASVQIAKAIHRHKGKVTVFVPFYAMSGGTLIGLAADEIVMCPYALLGPVDPQVGNFPAASLLKVVKRKSIDEVDDTTLILADQAEKAIEQLQQALKELLADKMAPEEAENLARTLTEGRWTHDYPITFEEAKKLGFNVSDDMPEDVLKMMALYPQPIRRQQAVEYTPSPRRTPPSGGEKTAG